jgi:hypothetical protein
VIACLYRRFLMPARDAFKWVKNFTRPIILPLLLAVIPTLYHYSNNVEKLTVLSLMWMLGFNVILAILFYFIFAVFNNFQPIKTAITTFVFLIFFNVYGLLYKNLIDLDVIRIKHYTLLPLLLMMAIYSAWLITRLKSPMLVSIARSLIGIAAVLVALNVINIVPAEIIRWKNRTSTALLDTHAESTPAKTPPDIYYIVLDEFAGFQAMREYWRYDEVDDFVKFLKERGFLVAEESHGSSIDTLHQMAIRLNYQDYPLREEHIQTYFNDIADNRVMRFLKSHGYTTVVFDETSMGYPSAKTVNADYLYEYGSSSIPRSEAGAYGFYFDEFGELVIGNTMLYILSEEYKENSPLMDQHSNMIYFTVDNIADKKIASPKFVYVHLLLPHAPFRFDRNGGITDSDHSSNWNYYLDNYIFSIKIARSLIDKILLEADPQNAPVIIIQSDHGARNQLTHHEGSVILQHYPEDFKTLILYAFHIPGYDYSGLPQDLNPINTFPIVFNYLFDENIILVK